MPTSIDKKGLPYISTMIRSIQTEQTAHTLNCYLPVIYK